METYGVTDTTTATTTNEKTRSFETNIKYSICLFVINTCTLCFSLSMCRAFDSLSLHSNKFSFNSNYSFIGLKNSLIYFLGWPNFVGNIPFIYGIFTLENFLGPKRMFVVKIEKSEKKTQKFNRVHKI